MNPLDLQGLLARYARRGCIIDANLLLVYLLGLYDPSLIERFKRTAVYSRSDFELLNRFTHLFQCIVTTPNILTEVSNLAGALPERTRHAFLEDLRGRLSGLDEQLVPSVRGAAYPRFHVVGLTDAVIAGASRGKWLVLTDDLQLAYLLAKDGADVINFNHLRQMEWESG